MMKCISVIKYGRFPQLIEIPIPNLSTDQFLIKMKYAPINPSDINFFQGFYGIRKQGAPIVGFQGVGIITQSANSKNKHLIGRKVSVLANMSNGTYSSHIISNQKQLIIWPEQQQKQIEGMCMQWINPVSCIGLTQNIQKHDYKVVILSAATSQLCKMMIKYIKQKYPSTRVIGFSRSQNHDNELINMGLSSIHRVSDVQAIQNLKLIKQKALFLDCVGGQFASKTFNNLPPNSTMISYGRLSKEPLNNIDLGELYFKNKKIEGFWMNTFLAQIDSTQLENIKQDIIKYYQPIFKGQVRKKYQMQKYLDAFRQSTKNASQGKIILCL